MSSDRRITRTGFCMSGAHSRCKGWTKNGPAAPNPIVLCECVEDGCPHGVMTLEKAGAA